MHHHEDAVENEAKSSSAVTRGQNAMYLLPHDAGAADEFLAPVLARVETGSDALQLLVLTGDVDTATALAAAVVRLGGEAPLRVVPVTAPRRAERRVREGAHVVIGTPADVLALVSGSALKLDALRAVVLAWADAIGAGRDAEALEALFADVPKTVARVVVATEATEAVEALIERYARRPRRPSTAGDEDATPVAVQYLMTAVAGRGSALRRVVEALDAGRVRVYARTEDSTRAARQALAAMGHGERDAAFVVTSDVPDAAGSDPADLAMLFDLPASASMLAALAASAKRVVALLQPRQLPSLRALSRGGAVSPLTLPDVAERGREEVAALRAALRAELAGGGVGREVLVLEPLLEEFDPVELAAAALRLVGRSGGVARASAAAGPSAPQGGSFSGPMTKLFLNVGAMDNARPADFVGAIVNEAGIQRDQVGRVDVRDKHSVVEVDSSAAEQVIERLSGASIRGRRVQARVDQERPPRTNDRATERGGERGERPSRPRSFDRGDRPARPRGGERSFDRGDAPSRPRSFDRADRADRPTRSFDRSERPPRAGGFDRDRGPSGPRAGGSRGDRPARPPRDDRGFGGGGSGGRGFGGGREGGGARGPGRPTRPRRDP